MKNNKTLIIGCLVGAVAGVIHIWLSKSSPIPNPRIATVMITDLNETSGGSGSIFKSGPTLSAILTNGHVCDVAKHGGLVHTYDGKKHLIVGYSKSARHDLCLAFVQEDLGYNSIMAKTPPRVFDYAMAVGHPRLLPIIATEGKFSEKKIINVMKGMRECAAVEFSDPNLILFCLLAGGLPEIRKYETIVVSALVEDGSSGSAVYNSKGEIAAVIFAGRDEPNFGFAIPFEYIYEFVTYEIHSLAVTRPTLGVLDGIVGKNETPSLDKFMEVCTLDILNQVQSSICHKVESMLILE
jgi:S1-C subfamily serine protease